MLEVSVIVQQVIKVQEEHKEQLVQKVIEVAVGLKELLVVLLKKDKKVLLVLAQ